jgi:hypothetical protein
MRERGNIWPVVAVAAAALCVLVIVPLIVERQKAGRMATVDAHVSIGDAEVSGDQGFAAKNYRWPNGEVPRTAERLRDVTGVTIAAATFLVEESLHRRMPRDAEEILTGIGRRRLIPNEWRSDQPGVLRTPHATIHLRYAPRSLTVELISVPNERVDGPAILIRIPDGENTALGTRYFESMQLDELFIRVRSHPSLTSLPQAGNHGFSNKLSSPMPTALDWNSGPRQQSNGNRMRSDRE